LSHQRTARLGIVDRSTAPQLASIVISPPSASPAAGVEPLGTSNKLKIRTLCASQFVTICANLGRRADFYAISQRFPGDMAGTGRKPTASRRKVQFGPRVRAQLVAQRRRLELSSPHVFPNRAGAALNLRWMSPQMWRRVLKRADVAYRPIGQTPHTYAVMMLQRGARPSPGFNAKWDILPYAYSPLLALHSGSGSAIR